MALRREVCAREGADSYESSYWACANSLKQRQLSKEDYSAWIFVALRWEDGSVLLPQFGLLGGHSAEELLASLPAALLRLRAGAAGARAAPLLKRRSSRQLGSGPAAPALAAAGESGQQHPGTGLSHAGVAAEARLARRVDEIYRELTREVLDDEMREWGDGGQARLRRREDGSFELSVSRRRGAAACGYGTPLSGLSDGDRDVCALALLLALPWGAPPGLEDALPPFVVLDEPDSRLDKRHSGALWRFLSGPTGPSQCLLLSLDNHEAFRDIAERLRPEAQQDEADRASRRIRRRFAV